MWLKLAEFAEFETERLLLRPFRFSDVPAFYQLVAKPEDIPFIFPACQDQEDAEHLLVHYYMKESLGKWAIVDKTNDQLIGAINFEKIDSQKRTAELGYFIAKSQWGRGIATEAVQNVAFFAFTQLMMAHLDIITHLENTASQKVAKKAGFKLTKQYKGSDRYSRKTRDYCLYRLRKTDYKIEKEKV